MNGRCGSAQAAARTYLDARRDQPRHQRRRAPGTGAERITRLARLVGRENVIAGTDCGFAQGPLFQRVHPSIMWAKFGALVEGAKLASKELWS